MVESIRNIFDAEIDEDGLRVMEWEKGESASGDFV